MRLSPDSYNNQKESRRKNIFFKSLGEKFKKIFLPIKNKIDSNERGLSSLNYKDRIVYQAKNWPEFYQAIDLLNKVKTSSGQQLSSSEVKSNIYKAYNSVDPVRSSRLLTREFGIRKKYSDLLIASRKNNSLYGNAEYIHFGNQGMFQIKNPEKYDSQSVDIAVSSVIKEMGLKGVSIENRKDVIYIVASVVDSLMPYDHRALSTTKREGADKYSDLTEILEKDIGGKCRHQAPFLTAVLKRLGFDAYQVSFLWKGLDEGHTLAYIGDFGLRGFVNPGKANDNITYMDYFKYLELNKGRTYNWKYRSGSNKWINFNPNYRS